MKKFTEKYVLLNLTAKDQAQSFEAIAQLAKDLKITSNKKAIVDGLIEREKISTTGMAEGFAIPHTMLDSISEPAVIVSTFKTPIDWKSIDEKPVKIAITLLIPKSASGEHMNYLSKVATALMDEKFCHNLLNATNKKIIVDEINKAMFAKKEKEENINNAITDNSNTKYIVGVTACATGIAHTYMAKEALDKECEKLNYRCNIETEGQNGINNPINKEMIAKADAIIVATDINVETDRFIGKNVLFCDTNQAINKPGETIAKALKNQTKFLGKNVKSSAGSDSTDVFATTRGGFMKHFLSGVSKMIPFIVFSGIVYAIINAIAMGIYGIGYSADSVDPIMRILLDIAGAGFTLFIGVMGGYIADSIGGRAAFGPGFMATFVASTPAMYFFWNGLIPNQIDLITSVGKSVPITGISLSILAALIMGFSAGYLVKWFNTFKIHKLLRPLMSILIIPVVCTSILIFPFMLLLSGPLGYVMNGFAWVLATAGTINGVNFLIGFILGFMVGFDMGGPINKIATATATALIIVDPRLMGAVAAAIPVAPFGCGLATFIGRKMFNENEKALGVSSMALGFMGISEGALPFAAKWPKQVIIANVIASGVGGGLAFLFCVGGHVGMWGGPIDALVLGIYADEMNGIFNFPIIFTAGEGYIAVLWFFIAMAAGTVIQSLLLVSLIKIDRGEGKISRWKIWEVLHISKSEVQIEKHAERKNIYQSRIKDLSYLFNLTK